MTAENGSETNARRPRWLYPVLIASLALNLLIVGAATGAMWSHRHGHHRFGGERGLFGFVRELPRERQTDIREVLEAEREKLKPLREAARTNWTESNEMLGTEPFDRDKYKASLDRMNEAQMKVRTAITDTMADLAARLTPEERRILKDWRQRKAHRWHKRHWGRRESAD